MCARALFRLFPSSYIVRLCVFVYVLPGKWRVRLRTRLFNSYRLKYSCWSLQTGIVSSRHFAQKSALAPLYVVFNHLFLIRHFADNDGNNDHHIFTACQISSRRIANKSLLVAIFRCQCVFSCDSNTGGQQKEQQKAREFSFTMRHRHRTIKEQTSPELKRANQVEDKRWRKRIGIYANEEEECMIGNLHLCWNATS